ncbi:hypothetical protein D3C83_41470 [compost metagenome]
MSAAGATAGATARAGSTLGAAAIIGIGAAKATPARPPGFFAMRILMPFSVDISIESTDESSIISMSFFT